MDNMLLQNMVELGCGLPGAGASSPFCFVKKPKGLLQVLTNPFSQLCGQPVKDRVASPEYILQPVWGGTHVVGPGGGQTTWPYIW